MQCLHCDRTVRAKGLCNAHYLRDKRGLDMDKPVESRVKGGKWCAVCGIIESRSGEFCKFHKRLHTISEILKLHGDYCADCKQTYPWGVYDLHHLDPSTKLFSISSGLRDYSTETVLEESKKCVLLCSNCHRLRHIGERSDVREST